MERAFSGRRVLLADDDLILREALSEYLSSDAVIEAVCNGDDAMARLRESAYDVLIADMRMPGLHGLELLRQVRQQWPDMDVLVMTGYPSEFPYVDAIRAGASDFIAKPHALEEIGAKLVRILEDRARQEDREQERTEFVKAINRLEEERKARNVAEEKYRLLFELSMTGMVVLNHSDRRIVDANKAYADMFSVNRDELLGKTLADLLDPASWRRLEEALVHFARPGRGTVADLIATTPGGQSLAVDASVSFIDFGEEEMLLVSFRDVTELRDVQQRLAEIASKDGITGLLNPRTFHTHIEGTVARLRTRLAPTTLVLIDIDNFKHCNDTYGHQQGDELLQRVGDLILESIRKGDQGYRYGGDEFAILLHGADATIGSRVGERLRTVYIEGESFGTSMSVGVAQYQPGMDARDFVRAADKALYEAKGAGKNQIHVA